MAGPPPREFAVSCLCAEWCGVCREYRPAFLALAERFPQAVFTWLDVEDDAEEVGELDVEDFPTISVKRGDATLFHGAMPPQPEHLARVLTELLSGEKN
jgi:thiol-disulfide isomerase/thioredoxin